jgi:CDK-activating kinase assembly factor MAT1
LSLHHIDSCSFNKQQSDFDTLRDYNDYLEKIEDATWNLILDVDVEETRRSMKAYVAAQNPDSSFNNSANRFSSAIAAPDPTSVVSETSHVVLKKGAAQRKALANTGANTPAANTEANTPMATGPAGSGVEIEFNFRGLKKKKTPEPELPFDPFEGWAITPQYYTLAPSYSVDWLTASKDDIHHIAGGYNIHDFYSRALCDAFSGIGVFVEEEKEHPERLASGDAEIASHKAAFAVVSKDVEMDDVF